MDIARALDKKVLAAGVERQEQVHFLQSCGCDLAQGFYIADPVPASEIEKIWRDYGKSAGRGWSVVGGL